MTVTRKCMVFHRFPQTLPPGGARACKAQRSGVTGIEAFAGRRKAFLTPVTTIRDRLTPAKADGRDASDRLIQPLRSQAEGRALPYGKAAAQVSAALKLTRFRGHPSSLSH